MTYIVIIPIFNEEQNISNLIRALSNSFLINDESCINILLVNDGSNDNSKNLIKSEIKNLKKIILLNHEENMGYGAAILTGINYSKNLSNYNVFLDSDLTNPIDDIKRAIVLMNKNVDYIQANRYKESTDNIQPYRKFIGVIGNFLCRFFMNMNINDYTNGFRAVKTNLYNKVDLRENDFSIIMEEKYKLKKHIHTIAEFQTVLGSRAENLSQSSFQYSLKLITKYLFYCVMTIFKINKHIKKID